MDFLNIFFNTIFNTISGILFAEGPIGKFLWNLSTLVAWFLIVYTFFGIIFSFNKLKTIKKFFIQKFETVKKIHYYMKSNPDDGIHIIDYEFIFVLIYLTLPTSFFIKILMWLIELFSSAEKDLPSFWKIYLVILYFLIVIAIPIFIYKTILTWLNANTYDGERKDGKMHGQGKLVIKRDRTSISSSEITYIGQFKNGFRHGLGEITFGNGEIYEGEFVDGLRHGNGKEISSDRVTYEGEWKNRCKCGQGIMSWPDGSKLVGEFLEKSYPHSLDNPNLLDIILPGTFISPDGKKYEWEYCNGNGELFDKEENIIGKISIGDDQTY